MYTLKWIILYNIYTQTCTICGGYNGQCGAQFHNSLGHILIIIERTHIPPPALREVHSTQKAVMVSPVSHGRGSYARC